MLRAPSAIFGPLRAWRPASQCDVCRSWCTSALCDACIARFAAPQARCARCGLRLGLPATSCGDCQRDPPPCTQTVCAADYAFPWDALIARFKFRGRVELAGVLAARIGAAVQRAGGPLPQRLLPVPLSAERLAERGYNQAWELARRVGAALRVPTDATLLQRPLATVQQSGLQRAERQRNLHGAFMVDPRRRALLQGQHVALLDDVMTTGATAREATRMLLRAGAARVDLWVLARTPEAG